MELTDLSEFLDSPRLSLEIRGRKFTIEPVSAKTWLKLQAIQALMIEGSDPDDPEKKVSTGVTIDELAQMTLGEAFDEIYDYATPAEVSRIGVTAFYWQLGHEDAALEAWRESTGKAPAPVRRRSTSTTTAAASTTPKRTRSSGTTSPRKSPRK